MGDARAVWDRHVAPQLDEYMGKAFEEICREAFRLRHDRWSLPAARTWGRWEGRDRNRRSIEIDLVARLDDARILTGEVKWSSRPIGPAVHRALVRDLEDLGRSGQGWANDALDPDRTAGHLYVSAGGFTDEFRRIARDDAHMRLLDLNDLYDD